MKRIIVRRFPFVSAAFAALVVAVPLAAQQARAVPEPQNTLVTVAAPSWQKGAYWTQVDHQLLVDFGGLARFRDADVKLGAPAAGQDRVVFLGDSITDGWNLQESFPGKAYINRGIGGQTTSQMLLRFRQDVIDLKPKVVVILAGTNDLAENTGPVTLEQVEGNLMSMVQLAGVNGIRVVLCSVLPADHYSWHPELGNPAPRIAALNEWAEAYAAEKGYVYVDYYSAMKDAAGGLPPSLSEDGVHPLPAGYAIMAPLAESGIEKALRDDSGQTSGTKN
jgi:acyl-CoA thioesterase I